MIAMLFCCLPDKAFTLAAKEPGFGYSIL